MKENKKNTVKTEEAALKEKEKESRMLSDDDLDQVSGGVKANGSMKYARKGGA